MTNLKKVAALLILAVFALSMLAGCSPDEIAAYSAIEKMSSVTSMESNSEITIHLKASGLSAQDQADADKVTAMINGMKIVMDQKLIQNEQKTVTKQQMNINTTFMGLKTDIGIWADMDISGSKPAIKEVISIPAFIGMSLPAQYQNKQYMVIDTADMSKASGINGTALQDSLKITSEMQSKLQAIMKSYIAKFDPGFALIAKKGEETVNSKSVTVYELKLDDAAFKSLLRSSVSYTLDDKDTMTLIKEFLYTAAKVSASSTSTSPEAKKEMDKALADFDKGLPAFKARFNQVMDAFKNIKLVGDKGIIVDYYVNSEGNIEKMSGTFDFIIDVNKVETTVNKLSQSKAKATGKGIYTFGVDFVTNITSMNGNIDITLPELNSSNSFSYAALLKSMEPAIVKDVTPPAAPVVNKLTRKSTVIAGKAEPSSVITVKKNGSLLGTCVTNTAGRFSKVIKKQKAGTVLLVTATDKAGNVSKVTKVVVSK